MAPVSRSIDTFSFAVVSVTALSSELTLKLLAGQSVFTTTWSEALLTPGPADGPYMTCNISGASTSILSKPSFCCTSRVCPFFSKLTTGFSGFHCARALTAPNPTTIPRHNTTDREPLMPEHPLLELQDKPVYAHLHAPLQLTPTRPSINVHHPCLGPADAAFNCK